MSKIFKTKTNSKKITYGLAFDSESNSFGVHKLCENYSLGKIRKSWRYVQINMTREEAEALFNRRTK